MKKFLNKIENWFELQSEQMRQQHCTHEEWDMDNQIRTIRCRKCGKRAWVREITNLYK